MDSRRVMRCSSNGRSWMMAANWILVVVMCGGMAGSRAWDCAAADRQTLLDFKAGFVDRGGVFSTWNGSTNCCAWNGITCSESDGHVLELTLVGASGSYYQQSYRDTSYSGGTVGAGLVSLAYLQTLTIQWVLFNGPIPSEWGEFSSSLQAIVINNANLRDDIPSSLASIPNLETLNLKSNHLTGGIPRTFCNSKSITYIDVSYNDMNYLLVPSCLQAGNGRNVTVVYNNQGQSSSPGAPDVSAAAVASAPSVTFAALSSALLLRTLLLL